MRNWLDYFGKDEVGVDKDSTLFVIFKQCYSLSSQYVKNKHIFVHSINIIPSLFISMLYLIISSAFSDISSILIHGKCTLKNNLFSIIYYYFTQSMKHMGINYSLLTAHCVAC